MCGICGFLNTRTSSTRDDLLAMVGGMTCALVHRGPDDSGAWVDDKAGIALGHRRLSILDLSAEGAQPMKSATDRFVIAFNGEIYNWRQLREQLLARGHRFRGHSDTEVLLAGVVEWGLVDALRRSVGMFAFALWDAQKRLLHLGRDRLGEKPLYYGWCDHVFVFGSELKALRGHPKWLGDIDRAALSLLLRHNYIPAPYSIYRNIRKLPPGTLLTIDPSAVGEMPQPVPYWSARDAVQAGAEHPFTGSDAEATDELNELLTQAIRDQMVADVPLGAFLSGGIDSSTVVGIMQANSSRRVKTFSIGFPDPHFDEAPYARAVAAHLGTDHTEYYVTPEDALDVIPRLPTMFDEPFADSSQIPTFLVAEIARKHVTVSLSGDGGDELFGGYSRYLLGERAWSRVSRLPLPARRGAANVLRVLRGGTRHRGQFASSGATGRLTAFADRAADALSARTPEDISRRLTMHWYNQPSPVISDEEPQTILTNSGQWPPIPEFVHRMMYVDALMYLPDDILAKVDRASMATSLESRAPFLDHRVFEFSWRLPRSMKIRNGVTKWVLRQVAYRYVPQSMLERRKMGFGVPLGAWLRGPLRDWAESLLDEARLAREGFIRPAPIQELWRQHLAGGRDNGLALWAVLMFQSWLEAAR